MLSSSTPRLKARLLYDIWDPKCDKSLTKIEMLEMINIMLDLSIKHLPKLTTDSIKISASEKEIEIYTKRMYKCKELISQGLLHIFMAGFWAENISKSNFVAVFDDEENGKLLTPHGIRSFALSISAESEAPTIAAKSIDENTSEITLDN